MHFVRGGGVGVGGALVVAEPGGLGLDLVLVLARVANLLALEHLWAQFSRPEYKQRGDDDLEQLGEEYGGGGVERRSPRRARLPRHVQDNAQERVFDRKRSERDERRPGAADGRQRRRRETRRAWAHLDNGAMLLRDDDDDDWAARGFTGSDRDCNSDNDGMDERRERGIAATPTQRSRTRTLRARKH